MLDRNAETGSRPESVVINLPGVDVEPAIVLARAAGCDLPITVCDYDISHEVRSELAANPDTPEVRASVPQLTTEQGRAFASATALLSLDLPLDLIEVSPHLRWVQLIGSGADLCVAAGLVGSDVQVTNAPGVSAEPIAEFVLARLLEHWKRLPEFAIAQTERDWQYQFGRRAAGRTVAIVGLGAIGGAVATLARALGMHTVGTRRSYRPGDRDARVDELRAPEDLRVLVEDVDAVVVCATGTPENENLISAAVLDAMPAHCFLVNVSRGLLVDETALVDALETGSIAGAALDVTREEPLPPDSPLWAVPNLRLSPHSSATMDGYFEAVFSIFVDNLVRYSSGQPLQHLVDLARRYPERGSRLAAGKPPHPGPSGE